MRLRLKHYQEHYYMIVPGSTVKVPGKVTKQSPSLKRNQAPEVPVYLRRRTVDNTSFMALEQTISGTVTDGEDGGPPTRSQCGWPKVLPPAPSPT